MREVLNLMDNDEWRFNVYKDVIVNSRFPPVCIVWP